MRSSKYDKLLFIQFEKILSDKPKKNEALKKLLQACTTEAWRNAGTIESQNKYKTDIHKYTVKAILSVSVTPLSFHVVIQ